MAKSRAWIALGLVIGCLIGTVWAVDQIVPPQHLPWKSLDPVHPIGLSTKSQLLRLAVSPSKTCTALITDIEGYETRPSEPKIAQAPCGWQKARQVYGIDNAKLSPGEVNMQCPLAVASFLWLREIDRLSRKHFRQRLAQVHHMGSYACRRQRGNGSQRWSEHAFANAWDISAFELADGTVIRILTDWDGRDRKRRIFLRDVRRQACRVFNTTLSPDFNAAHRNHFHVDMGPYSACH